MSIYVPGFFLYKTATGQRGLLHFQFNPQEIQRSRSVSFEETSALDEDQSSNAGGDSQSSSSSKKFSKYTLRAGRWRLSLNIRLDTSAPLLPGAPIPPYAVDLAALALAVKQLETLVEPQEKITQNKATYGYPSQPETPRVQFWWGPRVWEGYITDVSITEKMFTPDLLPKRVEANVSMVVIDAKSKKS